MGKVSPDVRNQAELFVTMLLNRGAACLPAADGLRLYANRY